jgi:hypothetical protein
MIDPEPRRPGWPYYAAVALFVAILAFAVLGLVRSSSIGKAATREREATPGPTTSASASRITPTASATGLVPTAQIPAPRRSAPTSPPSRTYLYPPPERAVTADGQPASQPRR